MSARIALLLCLVLTLGLTSAPPAASAQPMPSDFAIWLDDGSWHGATVAGRLINVPSAATAVTVTITHSNGAKRSVNTTKAQDWKFAFTAVGEFTGPWLQLAAIASNGVGASLSNGPFGGIYATSHGQWGSNYSIYAYGYTVPYGYGYGFSPDSTFGGYYGGYGYGYGYGYGGYGGFGGYGGYPYGYWYGSWYGGWPYHYWGGYPYGHGWWR